MSSHGKVRSRGNIPFSWEKRPGVRKATEYPSQQEEEDFGMQHLLPAPSPPPPSPWRSWRKKGRRVLVLKDMLVPPPRRPQPLLGSWWKKDRSLRRVNLGEDVQILGPLPLPPPPPVWPAEKKVGRMWGKENMQIPLPSCAFSSWKGFLQGRNKQPAEDPFAAAFKECTKSSRNGRFGEINGVRNIVGKLSVISCRRSCGTAATDDCIVRMSQREWGREREGHG